MLVYALPNLLIYSIGIPLVLFLVLFKWRRELNPPGYEEESRAVAARMRNKSMRADWITKYALKCEFENNATRYPLSPKTPTHRVCPLPPLFCSHQISRATGG